MCKARTAQRYKKRLQDRAKKNNNAQGEFTKHKKPQGDAKQYTRIYERWKVALVKTGAYQVAATEAEIQNIPKRDNQN